MKVVEIRRHSNKVSSGDSDLSEEGVRRARSLGSSLKGAAYTHLFVSTLKRTRETMNALKEGAGDFPTEEYQIFSPHVDVSSKPEGMQLWGGVCHEVEAQGGDMMKAVFERESEIANMIAREGAEAFRSWLEVLPGDAHALVIDHSPFIELVIYGLFNEITPQLQFLEGFRIKEVDGELTFESLK